MNVRTVFLLSLLVATPLSAAPMVRVASIIDGRSITVEGISTPIQLSGIEIVDDRAAADLLRWTIGDAWVMVENGLVYRSPDGLFINRELVQRGYARATAPGIAPQSHVVTVYLGELNPTPRTPAARGNKPPAKTKAAAGPSKPAAPRKAASRPTKAPRAPRRSPGAS